MWMEDEWMRTMNVNGRWMNEVDECEWKMNEWGGWMWIKMNERGRWI